MFHYCQMPFRTAPQAVDNIVFRGRIIWRDIATWLRAYLVTFSLQADPELQAEVANKLLSLPVEFGNMMRLFFGDKAAEDYTENLSNYIILLINLVNAQVNGDTDAVNEYTNRLYHNIDERSSFLADLNPFWEKSTLERLMRIFTDMTIQEINTFLSKQFKENIIIFDRILNHSSAMGDYVAQGIANYLTFRS